MGPEPTNQILARAADEEGVVSGRATTLFDDATKFVSDVLDAER